MKKFTLLVPFICFLLGSHNPAFSADKSAITAEPLKVEFVSPKEGEIVQGNITIEAKVNHPEAVEYCELYIQEPGARDRYGWKDYLPPYVWGGDGQTLDTTMFDDGPASAVVFCVSKETKPVKFDSRVHFRIDNGKPHVRILSPMTDDVIKGRAAIKIYVSDSERAGAPSGIASITVYLDGSIIEKMANMLSDTFLDTCLLSSGLHSIGVVAKDAAGLTAIDKVTIYVP